MAINIKNSEQIEHMKTAGRIVSRALELLEKYVKAGITTKELDKIAEEYILSCDAKPSFKGYGGFPASLCVSVNDEVIHGIPGLKKLKNGDIVSVDIGVFKNGFHSDAARTFILGDVSDDAKKLVEVTRQSFFESMSYAKPNCYLGEISAAVEDYVVSNGFSVVRDFVGHGIGRNLHEEPQVPHYRTKNKGPRLSKGMTLCVEPMVNMGGYEVKVLKDNWTVVTKDGTLSAHYENTILITDSGHELLTML